MSNRRESRCYVAVVLMPLIVLLASAGLLWAAVTDVSRPGLQQVDTAPKKPAAPAPLFMLPIPGLTTVSHPAPASMAIPLGTRLMLKQPASSAAVVQWWGATEVARDDTGSTAECSLNTLGWSHVAVEIAYPGGMVGEQAFDLNVIDIDMADIRIGPINVSAGPLPLDENLTNKQTMAYYFAGSVATVVEIGEGHYRTSVDRPLPLSVVVDPPGLAPLIEWRIDGAARHLGTALEDYRQQEIGTYVVSVGPPEREQSVQFDLYSVEIISHTNVVDILPEGVPITFEAVTHPGGFEDEITWLSSTKYGTAAPVVGYGPTFTAEFYDTVGPDDGRQWLGVIGDNARFGQDQKLDDLIAAFRGSDSNSADAAYVQLFNLGVEAIGPLLGVTEEAETYAGFGFQNDLSSIGLRQPAPVRLIAIYLVDGILWGSPTPHYAPIIFSDTPQDFDQIIDQAIGLYLQWWTENEGLTLEELQGLPFPLDGNVLFWKGPLLINQAAPGSGTEVRDSETRSKMDCVSQLDGPDADTDPDPSAWVDSPRLVGGPTPYNCLAWALGCQTDRWIAPAGPAGATVRPWREILNNHGYDTDNSVACAGQCPGASGPKIKMIFHGGAGVGCTDQSWTHAMKQDPDGEWSSKNGGGHLWKDIDDCDAFLDKHYKPKAGQFRTVTCFCK